MHRHGYRGRKLSLEAGPRRALIRGQVTSLVLYEQIKTTEAKAKEIAPQFEKLVTKAKEGTLASERSLRSFLLTEPAVQKMIQQLAPDFADRKGGYTRITKLGPRRGDGAPMAVVSLILPVKSAKPELVEQKPEAATKDESKKASVKKSAPKPKAKKTKPATKVAK